MNKDFTKGLYIPSIEAKWIYKKNKETGNYVIDEKYLDKLLNGKLNFSHELVMNKELTNNIEIKYLNDNINKPYTLDIINIKYKEKYKSNEETKGILELRKWTYNNDFMFNGKSFSNWKRTAGKSRQGHNLFCISSIKDKCLEWSRMGLDFTDDVDISGIRAYESLPLSSIIGTIEINPKNILVIDDYKSEFPWEMSKTWLENGRLHTKTETVQEINSIWDGQGLLSSKIFEQNELINGHGVALLRNRYMKCAGFCCNIEQYFMDYCEEHNLDYETFEVSDMYGNLMKVKDILLITTPSSIKLEKYNDNKVIQAQYSQYGKGAWLQYFKDNCETTFGVCKVDKPSVYDNGMKQRLSYQMVNTIPFAKDELKALVQPEIEYVNQLKNDLNFFLQEVNQNILQDEDTNSEDEELENNIRYSIDVTGAFVEMVKKNKDFEKTQVFKDFRRNYIDAYVKELRQGKILVGNADYCIACGNPIEMLKAVTGDFDGTSVLKGNELYCSRFKDGEDIVGFRNPSVNTGNIGMQVNKIVQEIYDYFNCTLNIVFLNSIDYPTLSTYQGEDFDIDCNLLTNNDIIVKACKRIDKKNTPIPVKAIESNGSNKKALTGENMAEIDHMISENYIGTIINLSQEINSRINTLRFNNLASEEELKELYKRTSTLSSISQVEIDKAKKQFQDLNIPKELSKLKKGLEIVDNEEIEKIIGEVNGLKNNLKEVKEYIRKYRKDKRKPINKQMRDIKKELKEQDDELLQKELLDLQLQINTINLEREEEIIAARNEITIKVKELQQYDSRRIKPNFFKYIGDKDARKQRQITNKKYRKELDRPIILHYCIDNGIDIKDLDLKDKSKYKDLHEQLKVNDEKYEEWKEKIYVPMDTPMDWLQDELNTINNKDKKGTIQVIQLVKTNTNKIDKESVKYIINNIKHLDTKIKAYRLNKDLTVKDKLDKIRSAKEEGKNNIKHMKLSKANTYGVLKAGLNSVKNNGKIKTKSGIESLTLEFLFEVYGTELMSMFV